MSIWSVMEVKGIASSLNPVSRQPARRVERLPFTIQVVANESQLQKAVTDPRLEGEALFLLAQGFHKKGFLDLARKQYERALDGQRTVDERAREILYNLGAIAEAEGDAEEARACYARIYAVDIGYRDVAAKMEQLK